jgi:signal transduction histidine kinase
MVGIAVAVAYLFLSGTPRALVYVAFAGAGAAAIWLGIRRYRPAPPAFWLSFAAALTLVAAGEVVWFLYENVLGVAAPFPSLADPLYLVGWTLLAATMLGAAHRAGGRRLEIFVDSGIAALGALALMWPSLIRPTILDPGLSAWARAIALAYPLIDVFMVAVIARLCILPGTVPTALRLMAAGMVAALTADLVYARLTLDGTYAAGHPVDLGWIAMYACFGAAALHPTMRALDSPGDSVLVAVGPWRRWLPPILGAAMVPIAVVVGWLDGQPLNVVVFLPIVALMLVLCIVRFRNETPAAREAALVGLVGAVAVLASARFEWHEVLDTALNRPDVEAWGGDNLVTALPFVVVALAVFAWRRWREAEAARRAAEEANRSKSAFLSTMSHELRTPMNAVIGHSHFLLDGMAGDLSAEQRGDVVQIAQGAERLLGLINNLLDLSRIEAGGMELRIEPVSVRDVVEDVRAELAPLAADKGIGLTTDIDAAPIVECDGERVRQILVNLVGNAIKFTDHGGVVMASRPARGGVEIAVADTGIGIPGDALPYVFDEFRQVDDATTRRYGGSGLGLAIARKLARLHGGDLTVSSQPRRGSTFTLWLPQCAAALPAQPAGRG